MTESEIQKRKKREKKLVSVLVSHSGSREFKSTSGLKSFFLTKYGKLVSIIEEVDGVLSKLVDGRVKCCCKHDSLKFESSVCI